MKFLVPNYSFLQKPWLGGYRLQIPVLSVLCPQPNLLTPPEQNFLGTPLAWGPLHIDIVNGEDQSSTSPRCRIVN